MHVSTFGEDIRFGRGEMDEVGQLYFHPQDPEKPYLGATLLIPESALPMTSAGLANAWKYLHLWTFGDDGDRASISAFSFSAAIHKNLEPWASGEAPA